MIGTELNTSSERIANQNQMLGIIQDKWVPLINAGITLFDYDLETYDYQKQKALYSYAGMGALLIRIHKNPKTVTDFITKLAEKLYKKEIILGATVEKVWMGILIRWTFDPSAVREYQEGKAQSDMETEIGNHEEGADYAFSTPETDGWEFRTIDQDDDSFDDCKMELRAEMEAERRADEYREREAEGW